MSTVSPGRSPVLGVFGASPTGHGHDGKCASFRSLEGMLHKFKSIASLRNDNAPSACTSHPPGNVTSRHMFSR